MTILGALFLVLAGSADGIERDRERLDPFRPSFAQPSRTVGDGHFELEAGYSYGVDDHGLDGFKLRIPSYPEAFLRYGLCEDFELQAFLPDYVEVDVDVDGGGDFDITGFIDSSIGALWHAVDEEADSWVPSLGAVLTITLPTGDSDLTADHVQPGIALTADKRIAADWRLTASAGWTLAYDNTEHSYFSQWAYTAGVQWDACESLALFTEFHGLNTVTTDDGPAHSINSGAVFYIGTNTTIDAFGTVGISEDAEDWRLGGGFTHRF